VKIKVHLNCQIFMEELQDLYPVDQDKENKKKMLRNNLLNKIIRNQLLEVKDLN
jgi:hypothetical protein